MHTLQSGGRSPKPLNGPSSTQQLKGGADSVQNSGTSFASQVKGKKREKGEQSTEPIKRERITKVDDGDYVSFKPDNMIKTEISKITDKGGLVNVEGVDKLIHLMQLDRAERKMDLSCRILLADVIAATDRLDCLDWFVQLRGVPVLDDWLQEAHKGRTGDGSSPKESDKSVEEFLLSLLRALDKLPVNLNALQTCNVGKSVNHLRSHKNLDIQKKARSLIDTWKKRVDAEMTKINDTKSVGSCQPVSWPAKQGFAEVSHGSNRRVGSTDAIMRNSTIQPSTCKVQPGKPGHSDGTVKSPSVTAGPSKLASSLPGPVTMSSKDLLSKATGSSGTPEFPSTQVKEEKINNSGQSQNNSLSSSDHTKVIISSSKEDSKSSTSGSMNTSKIPGGSSRQRRSGNGLIATTPPGVSRDNNAVKTGSFNGTAVDKVSPSVLSCERTLDVPTADHGNSHRLIVRLPNPGRSPARSASGGSFEDSVVGGSRASSPGVHDKPEQIDRKIKVRSDASRPNVSINADAESWHGSDGKELLVGSDEVDKSQGGIIHEERCRNADEMGSNSSGAACSSSSSGKEAGCKTRNSFSSINVLIDCAKFSEASASLRAADDIGMNLLASVAAGEISKSNLVSPAVSPRSSPVVEEPCAGNSRVKLGPSCENEAQNCGESSEILNIESEKHLTGSDPKSSDEVQEAGNNVSAEEKTMTYLQETELAGEPTEHHSVFGLTLHKSADPCMKYENKLDEEKEDRSISASAEVKGDMESQEIHELQDKCKVAGQMTDSLSECTPQLRSPSLHEKKPMDCVREKIEESDECDVGSSDRKSVVGEESQAFPPSNMDGRMQNLAIEGLGGPVDVQAPPAATVDLGANVGSGDDAVASGAVNAIVQENADESKVEKTHRGVQSHLELSDTQRKEKASFATSTIDGQAGSVVCTNRVEEQSGKKEDFVRCSVELSNQEPPTNQLHETNQHEKSSGPILVPASSSVAAAPVAVSAETDIASTLDFDLNEGFPGDDGNQEEPITSGAPVCSPAIRLHSLSPFVASPLSNGLPTSITIAAAAKGPFVPPENLLKSKAEPGWKGSAATSAFRPAEPRKVLEMPLNTPDVPSCDTSSGKQGRPALDFDLNVPDERLLEDMTSQSSAQTAGSESGAMSKHDAPIKISGGLDLDLNRADEGTENGLFLTNTSRKVQVPLIPVRPVSGALPNEESSTARNFDLNGPGLDEVGMEPAIRSQQAKNNSVPLLPPFSGLRMNNAELGNMSSWFPPGNSYPAVAIPSFLPADRGEQPYSIVHAAAGSQRVLGPATSGSTFGGDIYRGPVLSSSPSMAFSHAAPYPYAGFPFGSSFPLVSAPFSSAATSYVDSSSGGGQCFSTVPSQLVGPAGAVPPHYPRPYMISLPEGSASAVLESSRKWSRQGLDLNAGPGASDIDGREDRVSLAPRQVPVVSSQAFVEEQGRIYQVVGGGLKRKEPDSGWDSERYTYKQPSWQ